MDGVVARGYVPPSPKKEAPKTFVGVRCRACGLKLADRVTAPFRLRCRRCRITTSDFDV